MDFLRICVKDLKGIRREKTVLMVVALLMFVASFSSLIVTGLELLYSPSGFSNARIALVGNAPVFSSIAHPIHYSDIVRALRDMVDGKVDAVLVFNENLSSTNYITIYVPENELRDIKAILYLKRVIMEYQDVLRRLKGIPTLEIRAYIDGTTVRVPDGYSLHFMLIYVMLIPLLSITTAVVCSAYLIDSICEEFESGTLDVLLSATEPGEVLAGKVLSSVILCIALTAIWVVMLMFNGITVHGIATLIPVTLAIFSPLLLISLVTSVITKNREKAQLTFSILAIPAIVLMFSHSHSPLSTLVRVSAGSPVYTLDFEIVFFLLSLIPIATAVLSGMFGLE